MTNVLEYLDAAADTYPDKRAVACGDSVYTYAVLRKSAKNIGALLSKLGHKQQPVGVLAERSAETLILFFGVLYSGNFYVPLDPDMPTEKLKTILSDAGISVLLGTQETELRLAEAEYQGHYYTLQDAPEADCPLPDTDADEPLYMVYTSGSTGKPKGVLKSHRAEISYIEAYSRTFSFSSDEIIGNQTPFYFDASGKDIYLMLKLGCTMEILPTQLFSMPTQLIEYLNQKGVTFASWVPTAISIVAQLNPFSLVTPTTLKKLFFVGEVMPMKHLNKWRSVLPDIQCVNLYGQSELAGICCYYEVKGDYPNDAVLPIGKPLSNCHVYLVDRETVIAVSDTNHIGEIYIASDALAVEYWNDGEKTRSSFQVLDFGNGPERCFKTGDLAQYDADGNLLFAARTDFQIKHAGHRIELGEIETVAGALDDIGRCCCLYDTEKKKIVLFCQLSEGVSKTGREIQSLLRTKLSSYMVPGKVILMERLPLNANGKIDRQKLKEVVKEK